MNDLDKGTSDKTYLGMMTDILEHKKMILQNLIRETMKQEELLNGEVFNLDEFEAILPQKDALIKMLEKTDRGFNGLYEKIKTEMHVNKDKHKNEILNIQSQISFITDQSIKLRALEQSNKQKLSIYMAKKHNEFRDFRISSKTVSSYYKNMTGKHQGDSVFLDKKK